VSDIRALLYFSTDVRTSNLAELLLAIRKKKKKKRRGGVYKVLFFSFAFN